MHAALSQLGGGATVQVPPEQVEPLPPQSASEQQAEAHAQRLPCFTWLASQVKSQVPLPEQMLVPPAGAAGQGVQVLDAKQPVWVVFPVQTPPQKCCPAGHPMPDPVDALVETPLVLVALLVVVEDVVVPLALLVPLALVVVVGPLVAGSPPAPVVVGPGPSATPPPKPPSPSLLLPLSAARAQP